MIEEPAESKQENQQENQQERNEESKVESKAAHERMIAAAPDDDDDDGNEFKNNNNGKNADEGEDDLLTVLDDTAEGLRDSGKHREAVKVMVSALSHCSKTLGRRAPETFARCERLVKLLKRFAVRSIKAQSMSSACSISRGRSS